MKDVAKDSPGEIWALKIDIIRELTFLLAIEKYCLCKQSTSRVENSSLSILGVSNGLYC